MRIRNSVFIALFVAAVVYISRSERPPEDAVADRGPDATGAAKADTRPDADPAPAKRSGVDSVAPASASDSMKAGEAKAAAARPAVSASPAKLPADPTDKILRRFGGAPILAAADSPVRPDGTFDRVALILAQDFQYPMVRVLEVWQTGKGPGDKSLKERKAMVADHFLVRPNSRVTHEHFEGFLRDNGFVVREKIITSGLYLVAFTDVNNLAAYERARTRLRESHEWVANVESDWIVVQ